MSLVSLVLALVALAVAVLALRPADVVERRMRAWLGEVPRQGLASGDAPARAGGGASQQTLAASLAGSDALRRVAVVRYDAFEDLGGRMSFSAAIVDDAGRGLVLTAIHGRSETRSYVKTVPPADESQRQLSPEEAQALREAMQGRSS